MVLAEEEKIVVTLVFNRAKPGSIKTVLCPVSIRPVRFSKIYFLPCQIKKKKLTIRFKTIILLLISLLTMVFVVLCCDME